MNTPYLSFGEYLSLFMENRGYSGISLAKVLGEKSPTIISRLKADKCTPARCEAFLEQLSNALGDLTAEELFCFRRGLKVLNLGKESYIAYRAIHTLFTGAPSVNAQHGNLYKLLQMPSDAESCDIICMQCTEPSITDAIASLCTSSNVPLNIHHYITCPLKTSPARFAVSLLPILCDPRYELTELKFPNGVPQLGIVSINFIYMRIRSAGEFAYRLLLPCDGGDAISLSVASEVNYHSCKALINALDCRHVPLNKSYALGNLAALRTFLNDLIKYECGHDLCIFKRDFCFQFIPVDVLQSAFSDMPQHLPPDYANIITELRRLCYIRYCNACETTRPIRMLLSRKGLQDFMATGMLSDHFFGLRPFTPDERNSILRHIIKLAENNPSVSLYLAHDEALFRQHDFFIFDEYGVLIAPSHTDYKHSSVFRNADHAEVMLHDPLLTEHMHNYFVHYLLPNYASTADECLQYLRTLLNG